MYPSPVSPKGSILQDSSTASQPEHRHWCGHNREQLHRPTGLPATLLSAPSSPLPAPHAGPATAHLLFISVLLSCRERYMSEIVR